MRNDLRSAVQKQQYTLLTAFLTAVCMSFTIFFGYNSSLETPLSMTLIFSKPETNIFVLNVLSQVTILLLAELTSAVLNTVRWALASSPNGSSAYTFLALSRATNIAGVLGLVFGHRGNLKIEKDGYRLWGGQRYNHPYLC